ncbi:MAG: hypothetical protein ABI891_09245 [Acidobacteriota bacterium]
MNKKLKQNLSILTLSLCFGGLIGCSSTTKSVTNNEPNKAVIVGSEKTDKYPTSPSNRDTPTMETKASDDKIGVPECDNYIDKYEACITAKVPEASRQTILSSFKQTRQTWKSLAANPQTKSALASTCKQSLEMTKQAMSQYSCDW